MLLSSIGCKGPRMAKRSILFVALFMISCGALVGCQNQQVVENLPQPNFNGPNVVAPPVVVLHGAPVTPPAPAVAPKAPQFAGSVPREWIPASNVPKREWYWIVIHHSATPSGSEKVFDRE